MDAWQILEISPDATDEEIRAAYLRKVKEHPPDRSPEEFERIRDAWESLRDPRQRMRARLVGVDPLAPFATLLDLGAPPRRFAGPQPWLEVLKKP